MEWQPIESAPKDGTRVIVSKWAWVHRDMESLKRALDGDEAQAKIWHLCFATSAFFLADKGYWTDGLERLVEPTHFQSLPVPPKPPATHRCKLCGALWTNWADGTWSLVSLNCGQCCDNTEMGEQIEPLPPPPATDHARKA